MLFDSALVVAGTAVKNAITHMQLHSGDPGAAGTANVTSAPRVAIAGTVDADGDINWANTQFTGVASNGAATWVSYWTALTGGTCHGKSQISVGDTAANAAGQYTALSVTESNASV